MDTLCGVTSKYTMACSSSPPGGETVDRALVTKPYFMYFAFVNNRGGVDEAYGA